MQGDESITSFFSKLQVAWDEVEKDKEPPCLCPPYSCNKKENKDMLVSFILGLNEGYVDIEGQIMRMKPQPTLDMAYSVVLMEEQQRSTTNSESNNTASVVHQKPKKEYQSKVKVSSKTKDLKTEKLCDNCKKVGHTIDGCFYLKGFLASHPLHGVFQY